MAAIQKTFMTLDDAVPIARGGTPIRWNGWTAANQGRDWPWQNLTSHSAATDKFTLNAHGLLDGMEVALESTGTPPTLEWGAGYALALTTYFVRDAMLNDFKLCAFPGEDALDITAAGTGTLSVRRAKSRQWLIFAATEWWIIGVDGQPQLCHANDLSVEEMSGDRWTCLSEDCLARKQVDQLVLPVWKDDVSCADPIGAPAAVIEQPAVVPDEAVILAYTTTLTTTPEGSAVFGGGSSSASAAAAGAGGGNLLGGGNASGGGGGSPGTPGSPGAVPAGGGGGGDGGGGGAGDGNGDGGDAEPIPDTAVFTAHVELIEGYQPEGLKLASVQGVWFTWRAWIEADGKYANDSYSVRIVTSGPRITGFGTGLIWSGYLRPGSVIEGSHNMFINNPAGSDAYLSLQMSVKRGGVVIASDTSPTNLHFLND